MKFKIGDTVKGITFGTFGYETKEGKIVEIDERDSTCMYVIRSDGYKWHLRTETVELIEKELIPAYIKNELITLTRIDETTIYVNINHIVAFYHNKAWEYTIVILSDGTQLDIKDSVESIAEYF